MSVTSYYPSGNCIYIIELLPTHNAKTGDIRYVGQQTGKSFRIQDHVYDAYYRSTPDWHEKLRDYTLSQWRVHTHTAPTYDIPDFKNKYKQFCSEWEGKINEQDFAEIWYIQHYAKNHQLWNTQMGGKNLKLEAKDMFGKVYSNITISSGTPYWIAAEAFDKNPTPGISSLIDKINEIIRDVMMEKNWWIKYKQQTPANHDFKRYTLIEFIDEKIKDNWTKNNPIPQFFKTSVKAERKDWFKQRSEFKDFITKKQDAIKRIIKDTLEQDIKLLGNIKVEDLYTNQLENYLSGILARVFTQKTKSNFVKKKETEYKNNPDEKKPFTIPVTVFFNYGKLSPKTDRGAWMGDKPENDGMLWPLDQQKTIGMYIFKHYMKNTRIKINKTAARPYIDKSSISKTSFLKSTFLTKLSSDLGQPLSMKMKTKYARHELKGYLNNWPVYYKQMIQEWRVEERKYGTFKPFDAAKELGITDPEVLKDWEGYVWDNMTPEPHFLYFASHMKELPNTTIF